MRRKNHHLGLLNMDRDNIRTDAKNNNVGIYIGFSWLKIF
jgi:hypothetical protein